MELKILKPNNKLILKKAVILILVLFIILVTTIAILISGLKNTNSSPLLSEPLIVSREIDWITYTNEDFLFSLKHPLTLNVHEYGSKGGYLDFFKFEEQMDTNTTYKGIAVGVTEGSYLSEIRKVQHLLQREGGLLSEEKNITQNGFNAKWLFYKPKDLDAGEERVIVIINSPKYRYSISTTPGQIDKVLESFNILKETEITPIEE